MTTLTWDEAGYAFDVGDFDWDGNEIHTGAIDPTVYLDARGALLAYVASGPLASPAAIGLSSLNQASGQLREYVAMGTLRS